jgi:thiamine-phosphate pyrophosphorylase
MQDAYQNRMHKFITEVTVYPVSCEQLCDGRSDREWLDGVLAGGAKIVQLRDKLSEDRVLYEKALYFRKKTLEAGALFIVNNRLDIALLADADGLHVGNSDLPAEEVRRLAPDLIIGVSANTAEQAASAEKRGASYFNIGPIYLTATKKKVTVFLGPDAIPEFSSLSPLPFTVMGGIKLEHIGELVSKGARRLAVVTAISQAADIAAETGKWIQKIKRHLPDN